MPAGMIHSPCETEQEFQAFGTGCFRPLELGVSGLGTGCFRPWNWVFQALKLSVCRSFVLDVVPTYPVNGGCMRGMHQ